LGFFFAF